MELTYASEQNNSEEYFVNTSSSPKGSLETFVYLPTLPAMKEVTSSDCEKPNVHEENSAQAAFLDISSGQSSVVDSLDSSSQVPERSYHDFTKHNEESNSPTATKTFSNSEPTKALKQSVEDFADRSSADAIGVNHMSVNISTGAGTLPTDEMKAKEDKICSQTNIAVKQEVIEESEMKPESPYKSLVDTAAPFESVREAVTKFGGIVDWKAHKLQMIERRKLIQLELEKVQKEFPKCKEELEAAEMAKSHVVDELENTKRIIEELKHDLEKAQIEEVQAKQDSELAQLRAQEIEQGVADEASVIAMTQMEVARERHENAVAEFNSVKEELRTLHEQCIVLVNERDTAIKRAEEVISAGREIEKRVEELTLELIASKGSLELAHAAHHEAEESRIGAALAKEQDCLVWDRELQQAQEELQELNNKLLSKHDVRQKLDANLRKLSSLEFELSAYVENILNEEAEGLGKEHESEDAKQINTSIKETLVSTKNELEEVKGNIEKAKNEANLLKVAATTLRTGLDNEKASLATLQQRENMASMAVSSLEAELDRTKQEIESVRSKETDVQERMVELPKILQRASEEAEDAKVAAHSVQEQLRKAKEEAEQTKAAATTAKIRLSAVLKETEASKTSERLAVAAVKALQESEEARDGEDFPKGVTLHLSEYYALSKKAHEAEELANERVTTALAQVESAKGSESQSLDMLYEASKEMDEKKEALEIALERAERANEGKLAAEQELRKWRADHEQRRKAHDTAKRAVNPLSSPPMRFVEPKAAYNKEQESKFQMSGGSRDDLLPNRKLRRKKSFFPLMGSLLSRKTRA